MLNPGEVSKGYIVHDPVDGVLTLETERFELSWRDAEVGALSDGHVAEFHIAAGALMGHLSDEASGDAERQQSALATRHDAVMFFSTIMNVAGTSISYPSPRNARYTNMVGATVAEPLDPSLPSEATFGGVHGINNPLNWPEYNK